MSSLLRRGYDGGFLTINISFSPRFVQLRKYIRAPGDYGIELAFPNARWAEPYFEQVVDVCRRRSLAYSIEKEDAEGALQFLYVNFERDDACSPMRSRHPRGGVPGDEQTEAVLHDGKRRL